MWRYDQIGTFLKHRGGRVGHLYKVCDLGNIGTGHTKASVCSALLLGSPTKYIFVSQSDVIFLPPLHSHSALTKCDAIENNQVSTCPSKVVTHGICYSFSAMHAIHLK